LPSISCVGAVTVDADQCEATAQYSAPTASNLCAGEKVSLFAGLPSGSTFPIGTTTNQFDVVDVWNNVVGNEARQACCWLVLFTRSLVV
jgi:hypothetical protein